MSTGGGSGDDDLIGVDVEPPGILPDPTISRQAVSQTLFRGDPLLHIVAAEFNIHTHITLPGQMGAVGGIHARVSAPASAMDAKNRRAELIGFETLRAEHPEGIVRMLVAVTVLLPRCQHLTEDRLALEPVFRGLAQVESLVHPPEPIRARTKLEQDVPVFHA